VADYYEGLKERLRLGLDGRTILWIAAQTGRHKNQVQTYVSADVRPPVEWVADYCRALPLINPAWVLLGDPEPRFRTERVEVRPEEWLRAIADRIERERGSSP
jgi:hypothetical protein